MGSLYASKRIECLYCLRALSKERLCYPYLRQSEFCRKNTHTHTLFGGWLTSLKSVRLDILARVSVAVLSVKAVWSKNFSFMETSVFSLRPLTDLMRLTRIMEDKSALLGVYSSRQHLVWCLNRQLGFIF